MASGARRSCSGLSFFAQQFDNVAEISNRGVELGVSAMLLDTDAVSVRTTLSAAINRNRVEDLGGEAVHGTRNLHVVGYPLNSFFMPRVVSADLSGSGLSARASNIMCEGGAIIPGPLLRGSEDFQAQRGTDS